MPDLKSTQTSTIRAIGEDYRTTVRQFLLSHIPLLADAPIDHTEICLYTVAPDEQFQVDFLPLRPDVIVASPCSGHGFKFSCLIGRVLADLATTGTTGIAIDPWRIEAPFDPAQLGLDALAHCRKIRLQGTDAVRPLDSSMDDL